MGSPKVSVPTLMTLIGTQDNWKNQNPGDCFGPTTHWPTAPLTSCSKRFLNIFTAISRPHLRSLSGQPNFLVCLSWTYFWQKKITKYVMNGWFHKFPTPKFIYVCTRNQTLRVGLEFKIWRLKAITDLIYCWIFKLLFISFGKQDLHCTVKWTKRWVKGPKYAVAVRHLASNSLHGGQN